MARSADLTYIIASSGERKRPERFEGAWMTGGKSVGKVRYSIVAMLFAVTMVNPEKELTG